jgi:hypothetical protein
MVLDHWLCGPEYAFVNLSGVMPARLCGDKDVCDQSEGTFHQVDGYEVLCNVDGHYSNAQKLVYIVDVGLLGVRIGTRVILC